MAKGHKPKTCFVISPIGEEGSEIRERSDLVLEFVDKAGRGEVRVYEHRKGGPDI